MRSLMKSTKRAIRVIKFTQLATKIAVVCVFVLAGLFVAAHLFLNLKGKSLLEKKLQQALNRKINIGRLSTSFPLNNRIQDIDVEGFCKMKEVFLAPGAYDIFHQIFRLSLIKIIHPEIAIEKTSAGLSSCLITKSADQPDKPQVKITSVGEKSQPFEFAVDRLIINGGVFSFIDSQTAKEKITISAQNLNLEIKNFILGKLVSQITYFSLQADLPWRQDHEEGKVNIEGWLNLKKKDMQAKIKIEDIDGIAFYSYYQEWVDLENARIKKAKLNFGADVNSLNNDMTVHYRLELTDIVFKPRSPTEEEHRAEKIAHAVIGIFKNLNQGKIVLEQTIQTKMDSPEFGFDIIRRAFENKLIESKQNGFGPQEVLILPSRLIEGTFKGFTGVTTAIINGAFTAGREISRAVQDGFKNEDNPGETVTETE
jgi:hypothetical protein